MSRQARLFIAAGCAALAAVALLGWASSASATVTWSFTETALTYQVSGKPVPGFVAGVAGFLSVSNEDFRKGGISYSFSSQMTGISEVSGDTDFSLLDANLSLPAHGPFFDHQDASVNLSFDKTGNISGSVVENLQFAALQMAITDNNVTGDNARVASDGTDFQCTDRQCSYTGFWTLVTPLPVSEPGSAITLLAALPFLGLGRNRRITRCSAIRPRAAPPAALDWRNGAGKSAGTAVVSGHVYRYRHRSRPGTPGAPRRIGRAEHRDRV
ncbi:MAG TPA: hypothetical protein VGF34_07275 [Stellaceae bacterium]